MNTDWRPDPFRIDDVGVLAALYGEPGATSVRKEVTSLHPVYREIVEAAPFAVLATCGPDGLDASPRGDAPGFIAVQDEHTLLLPDRRGNNRTDSLRNVIRDPRTHPDAIIPDLSKPDPLVDFTKDDIAFVYGNSPTTGAWNNAWSTVIQPYVKSTALLFCPDDGTPPTAAATTGVHNFVSTSILPFLRLSARARSHDPQPHVFSDSRLGRTP